MYSHVSGAVYRILRPTASIAALYSRILPVARSPYRALPSRSQGRAGAGGLCFAATCCGFPCELRQGSPPLLSETGHCMLCHAMPDVDSAGLEREMWDALSRPSPAPRSQSHHSSAVPVLARPQTCHPTSWDERQQPQVLRQRYSHLVSGPLPPTAKLFFSFALRPPFSLLPPPNRPSPSRSKTSTSPPRTEKRKKPNRVTWAPSTARPSTPRLGLCENLKLKPIPDQTRPSRACAARLGRGSTAWNSFSQRPTCLLRPELQSAATSRRGISRA